jgi:hypothetical protein
LLDGCKDPRHQGTEITHAIAHAKYKHDADSDTRQVLLISKRFVGSDKDLEA